MAIKTVVFWGVTPEDEKKIRLELDSQIAAGTTDGSFDIEAGRVVRLWSTVEAAQAWIDFLNSFDTAPISAKIVQE